MTFEELSEKYTDRELLDFVKEINETDDYRVTLGNLLSLGFESGVGVGMVSSVSDPKASIWLIGQFIQILSVGTDTQEHFMISVEGQVRVCGFHTRA